jgi:hypothetical protein
MIAFMDLEAVLRNSREKKGKERALATPTPEEDFQEPKRKRRSSTEGGRQDSAKKQGTINRKDTRITTAIIITQDFFAPLSDLEMDAAPETGVIKAESGTLQRTAKDRPSPNIITSQNNLLKFQVEIKAITKGSFEFRKTKNGTRVITREMTI